MELNEKLQELRKKKQLTQEELAKALYVSRTAISKWESGRGYPGIDSLKAIAKYFAITLDELLSTDQLLTIAQKESKEKEAKKREMLFALLDCFLATFFFLPLFGQMNGTGFEAVTFLSLTEISPYLKAVYLALILVNTVFGILTFAIQNCRLPVWTRNKSKLSLIFNAVTALIFIISSQPYAATFLFLFLTIKVLMLVKWQ